MRYLGRGLTGPFPVLRKVDLTFWCQTNVFFLNKMPAFWFWLFQISLNIATKVSIGKMSSLGRALPEPTVTQIHDAIRRH